MSTTEELFSFVTNSSNKLMLVNAYDAITKADAWNFIKKDCNSFMFCNEPIIWKITQAMSDLGYNGHSGASFGLVLREMQFIAQNGIESYRAMYLNN